MRIHWFFSVLFSVKECHLSIKANENEEGGKINKKQTSLDIIGKDEVLTRDDHFQ